MYRSNAYNEGAFFTPVPVFRQMVVPGQSVELELDVMFETPPFLGNLMSGGVAQLYAFYCPFRLVWEPWMEFIADPVSGLTVPVSTTPWAFMFEKAGAGVLQVNSFMRRAYKLAFNQYFGSTPDNFNSWYANVDDDTDVTYRRVRTTDQFLGKLMKDSSISDPTYVAPVAGASATISLNDFRLVS